MNEEDVKLEGFEAEGAVEAPANVATEAEPADGGATAVEAPAGGESTSSTASGPPSPRAGKARDEPEAENSNVAISPEGIQPSPQITAQKESPPPVQAVQQLSHRSMESDAREKAQPQVAPERNLMAGFAELARVHPEVTKQPLPEDIFQAIVMGEQSPLSVYEGMMMRKLSAEIETLRKENQTLRQNAETAAKAPVKASTGAPQTEAQDEFLKGFNLGR